MKQQAKQQLNLLLLTDIHLHQGNLCKLYDWHQDKKVKYDYILCAGDTANCDHHKHIHDEETMLHKTNSIYREMRMQFGCDLYFIPGNHDPIFHYDNKYEVGKGIFNLHGKAAFLSSDLEIIGFGGSVPGYLDLDRKQKIWEGYPHHSDSQFAAQFDHFHSSNHNPTQRIYFTHLGPADSSTTIDRRDAKPIYAGAIHLNMCLQDERTLCMYHGHIHNAGHCDQINQKLIINPGPLLLGKFGQLKLIKQDSWRVASLNFIQV